MESSSSRKSSAKQKQEDIKRQIALLQAQLQPELSADSSKSQPKSPKRKIAQAQTLAATTPSPRNKRKLDHEIANKPIPRPVFHTKVTNSTRSISGQGEPSNERFKKPPPSNFLFNLAAISRKTEITELVEPVQRSTAFREQPQGVPKRNERLAIVEDLEPGPYEHTPPSDDPDFEKLEPHSGIHLTSRNVAHEDFKDYLRGRYYLSPSRLYSTIQLLPDKKGYDVPVEGDWVTVAVIAERGPIKFTRAPVTIDPDEDVKKRWKGKTKAPAAPEKPSGKKFVNLKLIDFGARSGSTSATGGKSVIRGDAFLSLLLFESDGFDLLPREDGRKPEKLYKGGSRGAFEHLMDVREGDVIALLNPKILKPFQRSSDTPHPLDNILALTPESASSIMVLGRSRDLGMCTVRRQDGKTCGTWCDKRVSDVCDYHVQNAVQRRRAARPEFSAGTSGLSTSSTHKRKNDYDPARQWGLKPDESRAEGATYVVSGHVVTGTSSDPRTMYMTEMIGREGQARAKRKLEAKDADRALKSLLERDKEGMQVVMKAREVGRGGKEVRGEMRGKRKRAEEEDETTLRKTAYSAEIIKSLGFDPSSKPGQRRVENKITQDKLVALETVRAARKDIALGPRPGPRIRSGVLAPKQTVGPQEDTSEMALDSADELVVNDPVVHKEMVDLDDL